jgi:tagatose 1,6-diphosphate aldolase
LTVTLTPGRWRGLKQTSTNENVFTILAFDQRGTYRRMLPEGASYDEAVQIKQEVVVALSYHASAVLLDATYGLKPAMNMAGDCGLLMAYEKSGYSGDATYRMVDFDPDWTIAKIKNMGASAVKLLVYYHPESGALADEIDGVVTRVLGECHRYDLPLFVEPLSYSLDASMDAETFAKTRPGVVRETARRLSKLGVDVLKMEFPLDIKFDQDENSWRAACESISEVSDVPWVLLSAGVAFETFERQTMIACQAGASGFLAGRAIWKESVTLSPSEREQFLKTTATERINRLNDVAHKYARRWTEFYAPVESSEDWFREYP